MVILSFRPGNLFGIRFGGQVRSLTLDDRLREQLATPLSIFFFFLSSSPLPSSLGPSVFVLLCRLLPSSSTSSNFLHFTFNLFSPQRIVAVSLIFSPAPSLTGSCSHNNIIIIIFIIIFLLVLTKVSVCSVFFPFCSVILSHFHSLTLQPATRYASSSTFQGLDPNTHLENLFPLF